MVERHEYATLMSTRAERAENRSRLNALVEQHRTRPTGISTGKSGNVLHALRMREMRGRHVQSIMVSSPMIGVSRKTGRRPSACSLRLFYSPVISWGVALMRLLHNSLGTETFWGELKFIDRSCTSDQFVCIKSRVETLHNPLRGRALGRLEILLRFNNPFLGLLDENDSLSEVAHNWDGVSCEERYERITLRPVNEFVRLFPLVIPAHLRQQANDYDERMRFDGLSEWTHAVYMYRQPAPGFLALYHSDYNISYPVVRIVTQCIRVHFARVRGEAAV